MKKCQYILEHDLPPKATADEIAQVRNACDQRATASLGRSAKESVSRWCMPEAQLRGAIIRHITQGKRMFHKYKNDFSGDVIPRDVQANVTLPIGSDVYVEVALMDEGMVIIYAHDHTPTKLRLPQ
jgi:hypothetical protein